MADIIGILSKDTTLGYKIGTDSTYTILEGLVSVPALGSEPSQIDVTNLSSANKAYIKGLQDTSSLSFGFIYQQYDKTAGSNFKTLRDLAEEDSVDWEITLPDGVSFTFSGQCSCWTDEIPVDDALKMTLSITIGTDIEVNFPT